jgi:hypothetical protein
MFYVVVRWAESGTACRRLARRLEKRERVAAAFSLQPRTGAPFKGVGDNDVLRVSTET